MKNADLLLAQLLNEPSFVAWVIGNGSAKDIQRWESWVKEDRNNHAKLVERARKLISMPFVEINLDAKEVLTELEKLKGQSPKLHLKKM